MTWPLFFLSNLTHPFFFPPLLLAPLFVLQTGHAIGGFSNEGVGLGWGLGWELHFFTLGFSSSLGLFFFLFWWFGGWMGGYGAAGGRGEERHWRGGVMRMGRDVKGSEGRAIRR